MALFLLENRDFLGFWMIFKVWLNQIFSNNVKYTVIEFKGEQNQLLICGFTESRTNKKMKI
jgi:hypothetical protein